MAMGALDVNEDIVLRILKSKSQSSLHLSAASEIKLRRGDLVKMRDALVDLEEEISLGQFDHLGGTLRHVCEVAARHERSDAFRVLMQSLLDVDNGCPIAFDANRHLAALRNTAQRVSTYAVLALDASRGRRRKRCLSPINCARRLLGEALPGHMSPHRAIGIKNPRLVSNLLSGEHV